MANCHQLDSEAAIRDFTDVIQLDNAPVELVAEALNERGRMYGKQGDLEAAMGEYNGVIQLNGAPLRQVAYALLNRGATYGLQGNWVAAIPEYTKVIQLAEVPLGQVARALVLRSATCLRVGDLQMARSDAETAVGLECTPEDEKAYARKTLELIDEIPGSQK